MEIVGRVVRSQEEKGSGVTVEYHCTNKEVFHFRVPSLETLPEDKVIRCWTERIVDQDGILTKELGLVRWEEL